MKNKNIIIIFCIVALVIIGVTKNQQQDSPIVGTYSALDGSRFTFYPNGRADHTPSTLSDVSYTSGTGSWYIEKSVLYVDITTDDGIKRPQIYAEIEDEDAQSLILQMNIDGHNNEGGSFQSDIYMKD